MKEKKAIKTWKSKFPMENLIQFRKIWYDNNNISLREHFTSLIDANEEMVNNDYLRNIIEAMSDIQLGELRKQIKKEPNRRIRRLNKK
ncbi:MAG: hypothetical protein WCP69_03285 [Bacteroidota bacterium]